ncbi:MAG: hypothetical protein AB7N65_00725 [Vicinamibacterales bacterium]
MSAQKQTLAIAALSLLLAGLAWPTDAAAQRRRGDDDSGRAVGRAVPRGSGRAPEGRGGNGNRGRVERRDGRDDRRDAGRVDRRGPGRDERRDAGRAERYNDRRGPRDSVRDRRYERDRRPLPRNGWVRPSYRYAPPRVILPRVAPRRYYGPGGRFSAYYGWGSGYRFGQWYDGRVYGYVPPIVAYGAARYYGDVRLRVRPRFAEVYVDGYYAGIVDDFDGVFQRLTLEMGRHEIEIAAPGYESRVYEIFVDAARTIDLHGDLYPY